MSQSSRSEINCVAQSTVGVYMTARLAYFLTKLGTVFLFVWFAAQLVIDAVANFGFV